MIQQGLGPGGTTYSRILQWTWHKDLVGALFTPAAALIVVPGHFGGYVVSNNSGVALWFQGFDSATPVVNGAVPNIHDDLIPPGGAASVGLDLGDDGQEFTKGYVWAWSTTMATLTLPTFATGLVNTRVKYSPTAKVG